MSPTVRYSSSLGHASITETPIPAKRTLASRDTPPPLLTLALAAIAGSVCEDPITLAGRFATCG